MTDNEMRDLFREMRDEPVPADSLARVRMGVAEGAGKRHWWIPLLVIAGCLIAAFLLLRPAKAPVQVQQPSLPVVAQVQPPPEITRVQIPPRPKRARPKQVAAVPVSMIRIETPDPEIVILLVN